MVITPQAGDPDDSEIPDLLPQPLPNKDALRIAELAGVPSEQQASFFDLLHWCVALVWMRDPRACAELSVERLVRVANAARTLHRELSGLRPVERKWVARLWQRTPWYKEWLPDLLETTFKLAHLLSAAAGKSPPERIGGANPTPRKSNRDRTMKDVIFMDFVRRLRMVARECGGALTLNVEGEKGTLIDVLEILRAHLPVNVIPSGLPIGTLKKISHDSPFAAPIADIDFFSPEKPGGDRIE